jgi:hypothetical protein
MDSDIDKLGDEPGEMGSNLPTIDLGTGRTAIAVSIGFFVKHSLPVKVRW